jgi:putative acetyltransferase
MKIRAEDAADREPIRALLAAAFGSGQEAELVDGLRDAGDLAVSLVAEDGSMLLGHVALSRLHSPRDALALAPLAVAAAARRRGTGAALVREALSKANALGAPMVFVLGDAAYYSRFGFTLAAAASYPSPYAGPHFMALLLENPPPVPAPVVYAAAFAKLT